jgi:hypothetical protein
MLSDTYQLANAGQFRDDFLTYDSSRYVDTNSGSGPPAITVGTAAGGWLQVPTKASLNDYRSLSLGPVFALAAGSPVRVEARLKISEAASMSSSWFFGLTDTLTAGFLSTAGAPPSSYNGAIIWKPKNGNVILFETASSAAPAGLNHKNRLTNIGTFTSGASITLGFVFDYRDMLPGQAGPNGSVLPTIRGQSDLNLLPLLRQPIFLPGMPPLYLSAGVLAGTAAAETLQVDYWGAEWSRVD